MQSARKIQTNFAGGILHEQHWRNPEHPAHAVGLADIRGATIDTYGRIDRRIQTRSVTGGVESGDLLIAIEDSVTGHIIKVYKDSRTLKAVSFTLSNNVWTRLTYNETLPADLTNVPAQADTYDNAINVVVGNKVYEFKGTTWSEIDFMPKVFNNTITVTRDSSEASGRVMYVITTIVDDLEVIVGYVNTIYNITAFATQTLSWSKPQLTGSNIENSYKIYRSDLLDTTGLDINLVVGFVGETTGLIFEDTNIVPDRSRLFLTYTTPFKDTVINASYKSSATILQKQNQYNFGGGIYLPGGELPYIYMNASSGTPNSVISIDVLDLETITCKTIFKYEERMVFAGFSYDPFKFIATTSGTNKAFGVSRNVVATDYFEYVLLTEKYGGIEYAIQYESGMLLCTNKAFFYVQGREGSSITATSENQTLTIPTSIHTELTDARPIIVHEKVIYLNRNRTKLFILDIQSFTLEYNIMEIDIPFDRPITVLRYLINSNLIAVVSSSNLYLVSFNLENNTFTWSHANIIAVNNIYEAGDITFLETTSLLLTVTFPETTRVQVDTLPIMADNEEIRLEEKRITRAYIYTTDNPSSVEVAVKDANDPDYTATLSHSAHTSKLFQFNFNSTFTDSPYLSITVENGKLLGYKAVYEIDSPDTEQG